MLYCKYFKYCPLIYLKLIIFKRSFIFKYNKGGSPRYKINNDNNFASSDMMFKNKLERLRTDTQTLANKHKKLIENYLNKK